MILSLAPPMGLAAGLSLGDKLPKGKDLSPFGVGFDSGALFGL
jgi:hypothetical protein